MEREARREGIMYSLLQPFDRPDLKQLVDRRIDVLSFMPVVLFVVKIFHIKRFNVIALSSQDIILLPLGNCPWFAEITASH